MERRKAITAAAAASLTLLAGAAGMALNSSIVGAGGHDNVGQLNPVSATKPPITIEAGAPVTGAGAPANGASAPAPSAVTQAPAVQPTNSPPVTASSASSYQDDDTYEEADDENVELQGDDHERYEGADDDD
jgi:hypothetical protein